MGEAKRKKQKQLLEAQLQTLTPDLIAACQNAFTRQGLTAFEITERAIGDPPPVFSSGLSSGEAARHDRL